MTKQILCKELPLSKDLLKAIETMGFKTATPIQAKAIPELMEGFDVVGQASTGTGKTAAFGLPIADRVDPDKKAVQALILCPTRELAMQVSVEMKKFLKYKRRIYVAAVYGGQPINRQIAALQRGVHIVIGTPGRILDHISRKTLKLNKVRMVVLDEADEMLDMGFRPDIERILGHTPESRQTSLFSATMPTAVLKLTDRYQCNPTLIKVAAKRMTAENVEQAYFDVEPQENMGVLTRLIDSHNPWLSIVFCNTKHKVDKVARSLCRKGYLVGGIHGGIRQTKRDRIMDCFRKSKINILVATDVAARGIDVKDVEIVFNYEIPRNAESYTHRIGRTGRAGKMGKALSLVSPRDARTFRDIRRGTNAEILSQKVSSLGPKRDKGRLVKMVGKKK